MARRRLIPTNLKLLAVVIAALLVGGACAAGDVPAAPVDDEVLVQGQALWSTNCVNCHGAAGGGAVGTKLNEGRLVERYPDPAEQFEVVASGRRAMPAFENKFTAGELEAVVRYTREIIATGS